MPQEPPQSFAKHWPVVLDIADDGLIGVDGEVLVPDSDLLLASTAVVIEPLGEQDHRPLTEPCPQAEGICT